MHEHRDSLGLACHSNLEEKAKAGQKSWKRYKPRSRNAANLRIWAQGQFSSGKVGYELATL